MTQQLSAEFVALLRYILRRRVVWFWLLAAIFWPISFVQWLGGRGTSPIVLGLTLAVVPVGPIVFGFIGAQLTDMAQSRGAHAILQVWPARPGPRTLAVGGILGILAVSASLATNAIILAWAAAPFWRNPAWVRLTVVDSLVVVGVVDFLWLAGGFFLGQWIRGFWKLLVVILAPAAWLLISIILAGHFSMRGSEVVSLFNSLQVAPFAWLSGSVSSIWGYGPYQHLFWLFAVLTALMAFFWLLMAALKGYGMAISIMAAGIIAVAGIVVVGRNVVSTLIRDITTNTYAALAAAYHGGHRSPVTTQRAALTIHKISPQFMDVTAVYTVKSAVALSQVRFFLNPAFHIVSAQVNGRSVSVGKISRGWDALLTPLKKGSPATLAIRFRGNPDLWASFQGGAYLAGFISSTGLSLPGGDWYPLLGYPGKTVIPWSVRLETNPGWPVICNVGLLGARGVSEAKANNVSLMGGYLGDMAYRGVKIYTGTDQLPVLRQMLSSSSSPANGIVGNLGTLFASLHPALHGQLIMPDGTWTGTPPYVETLDAVIPEMWPQGNPNSGPVGGAMDALGDNSTSDYMFEIEANLPQYLIDLWVTRGSSTVIPADNTLSEVVNSVLFAVGSGANGQVDNAIAQLPEKALPSLLSHAWRLQRSGHLTPKTLRPLVAKLQKRYG